MRRLAFTDGRGIGRALCADAVRPRIRLRLVLAVNTWPEPVSNVAVSLGKTGSCSA